MKWENVKFLDAVKDITGGNKKFQLSDYLKSGNNPIIDQGEQFIGGYTNSNNFVRRSKPVIVFGDHTKILKFVDFDFCLGADGVKVLQPIEKLDTKFLYYYLHTITLPNVGYSRHFKFLKESLIPLPPLPTQRRIAEILDTADTLRRKDQELLRKYDELAKAIFIDMFGDPVRNEKGWEVKRLGNAVEFQSGLVNPTERPYKDFYHVGGDNIESNTGKIFNLKKASDLNLISGKFYFTPNHILYNKIRPYLNKVAMPDFEGICSADMYPIFPNEKIILKDYLYFMLKSQAYLDFADKQSRRANIPKININEMSEFHFPVPPLKLQREFILINKVIEKNKNIVLTTFSKSQDTFYTLQNLCFSGELVA